MIVFCFVRINCKHVMVPIAIKYIIQQFTDRVIGSKLLSLHRDTLFQKLLSTKIPNLKSFTFLFRASDNEYSAHKFHAACDGIDKKGQLVIIESSHGNIFGGYTSCAWINESDGELLTYQTDSKAFLFMIKSDKKKYDEQCPMIFPIKKSKIETAICYYKNSGPVFGDGHDIRIGLDCGRKSYVKILNQPFVFNTNSFSFASYGYDIPNDLILCGGESVDYEHPAYWFEVVDYEVYQTILK